MEIPSAMFQWPELPAPLKRYDWAILYLPHADHEPFVKVPLVYDTYLGAQASVGIDNMARLETHKGDVAYDVYATYKIYMLLHSEFFKYLDQMIEIVNAFHEYCLKDIEPTMSLDTVYTLCTSVLPPVTKEEYGIHVLLTPLEIKDMTKSSKDLRDIDSIYFEPAPLPEGMVTR